MVSRFWWGHGEGKRGISWVSWKQLCRPKCDGGLGFRNFELFNDALLGKQAWRLVVEPDYLWARVMKAQYYHMGEFMSAEVGHRPSYTWRSIMGARGVLERGLR
ncbi:putative mitochondrial protein AtMg00310 [Silene latifolia]|uniref:putative mitochondrial protein AtMg00310 n=1 Tax=Silene latifolia TaxID=37657 RepID=UPI003D77297C